MALVSTRQEALDGALVATEAGMDRDVNFSTITTVGTSIAMQERVDSLLVAGSEHPCIRIVDLPERDEVGSLILLYLTLLEKVN